jgi:hypothetical protein
VARTNEAVLAGARRRRARRPGEADPVPVAICLNLRIRSGNGGQRTWLAKRRRYTRMHG